MPRTKVLKQNKNDTANNFNRKEELIEVATKFVSLIQSKSEFQEVSNLRVNTVKELVGNRLKSDSFLSWFINKINLYSDSTYCMSYAEEKLSEAWSEQCARKYQYKNATRMVKHLIVFLNVGRREVARKKRPQYKTYISYDIDESGKLFRACHYAVVVHNFETGVIIYGDSCTWAKPFKLDENISNLLFHLTNIKSSTVITLINASSVCYPFQTCGNICGVSIIILVGFKYEYFLAILLLYWLVLSMNIFMQCAILLLVPKVNKHCI